MRGTAASTGVVDRVWRRPWAAYAALYVVALAAAWWFLRFHHYRPLPDWLEADEREYLDLSSAILAGKAELNARRTLGFPLALAAIRAVHDNLVFLQAAVTAVYALAVPLLAALVRRLGGGRRAALAAGLALALWPPAIYYGTSLYSETLALPVFLGALVLLPPGQRLRGAGRRDLAAALAAGAVLGLATHVRPMYLLFTPFVPLIALAEAGRLAPAARRTLLVAAGYLAVIAPWSAVMTARFGHPILVTANGGETLAGGLNPTLLRPQGEGAYVTHARAAWFGPGKWLPLHLNGYLSEAELRLPYDRMDALLRARTKAWVTGHPGEALWLEGAKLGYMWGVVGAERNGFGQFVFGNVPTIALVVLSLLLLLTGRGSVALARLWCVPLFVSGVALISWGSWRFRQPADAALLALCALLLVRRWDQRAASSAATPGSAR